MGSSWTRDQTCVPWIVGAILNHWTTREALQRLFITQHVMEDTFINDTVLTVSYTDLQEKSVLVHLLVFLVLFLPRSSFVSVWISQLTSILLGVLFFFFPHGISSWWIDYFHSWQSLRMLIDTCWTELNELHQIRETNAYSVMLFYSEKGIEWFVSISQGIWWYNQYFLLKTESSCWVASSKLWRKESNGTTIPEKIYESI